MHWFTFPAPLWPSRAVMWPEYIVRSSLSTASLDPPVEFLYSFVKPASHHRHHIPSHHTTSHHITRSIGGKCTDIGKTTEAEASSNRGRRHEQRRGQREGGEEEVKKNGKRARARRRQTANKQHCCQPSPTRIPGTTMSEISSPFGHQY